MLDLEMVWEGELRRFPLEDGTYTVGRATECELCIPVGSVSRKHATIRIDGQQLFVKDLSSANGTDIEGAEVGTVEVEVPEAATLRFAGIPMWRYKEEYTRSHDFSDDAEISSHHSFNLQEGFNDEARSRIVEMLSSLFELLASEADTQDVEKAACAFVAEWVEADRVILLQDDGEGTELEARASWQRGEVKKDKLKLSTSIVKQVLNDREAVLVSNTMNDPRFKAQQSIVALDLRSAMAAPLFDNHRVRGILYIDSSSPTVQYSPEDLQVLSATANAVAVKLRSLTLEKEIRTAARIQLAMLPEELPEIDGYEFDAHLVMCRNVGGDLYHCLPRPNGKILVVLGDVAGKGVPASLAMAATIVLVRSLAEIGGSLLEMAIHLHRQLYLSLAPEQFVTIFLGELDPATGKICYVNAGHEPPLILRNSGEVECLNSTAMPMAMLPDIPMEEDCCTLEKGEIMAIFSDGIPEATADGNEFLELDGMTEVLKKRKADALKDIREEILSQVEDFLGKEQSSDDVTLMLLRRV